ncbi:MAG: phosphoglucosamine mutase, partial [Pyrinomonadaceae bacterium]
MTKLFGTDGIRGQAGIYPLDLVTLKSLGHSLAHRLAEKNNRTSHIIIGRDTRESGAWIEKIISEAATEAGARCDSAGVISTPGVAYLTCALKLDAGIVISASHNPYHDNGIKIFSPDGRKLDDNTERLLEADIAAEGAITTANGNDSALLSNKINLYEKPELTSLYADYLVEKPGRGLQLNGLKVVIDCAHGAASALAGNVFERLGGRVFLINAAPNGKNINLNSGSLHLSGLQQQVKDSAADLGVAFDG